MHKKEKTDAQRAKVFTKIGREITLAVKESGPDPVSNTKLRDLIAKAKENNVPNDNIERVIKKASGGDDGTNYEEIQYEGYGPKGVAIIVETLTDNRNRTAGDLRHYFDKFGGKLGQNGCVSYLFTARGIIVVDREKADEDQLMEDALEAGAVDFSASEDVFEIETEPNDLYAVSDALAQKGYSFESVEVEKVPSTYVKLENEDDIKFMNLLLEHLEDNDDVQDVWHNWEQE